MFLYAASEGLTTASPHLTKIWDMSMLRAHRAEFAFVGVLIVLVAGTTGCTRRRDNTQVVSEVQNRMRADHQLMNGRFQVTGTNGVITLAGYVVSNHQRAAAVRDAWQVKGVKVVVDNMLLVDSTRQSLSPALLKPPAPLQKTILRSEHPAIAQPSDAKKVSTIDNSPRPSLPESGKSDSPRGTASSDASVVPTVNVSSDVSSSAPLAASTTSTSAPEKTIVPYGTVLAVRLTESLSSELNEKGDTFLASLASPILVGDRVVIPEGAGIKGRVVEVQSAGRFSGRPAMIIEVTRLAYNGNSYDLRSNQYSKEGPSRNVRSAATIGGGAGLGAVLGGILGGGKGAAIGAMIGAGVGTGVRAASREAAVQLPAESTLSFRLQAALTVTPAPTLQRGKNVDPDSSSSDPFSDDYRPVLKRRPGSAPPETNGSAGGPSPDSN
jgi:BON domain